MTENFRSSTTRVCSASYNGLCSICAWGACRYSIRHAESNFPRLESNLNTAANSLPSYLSCQQTKGKVQMFEQQWMPGAEAGLRFIEQARKEPQWLQVLSQLREQDYCPHASWSRSLQLAFAKLSTGVAHSELVLRARACFQPQRVRIWTLHCFASVRLQNEAVAKAFSGDTSGCSCGPADGSRPPPPSSCKNVAEYGIAS